MVITVFSLTPLRLFTRPPVLCSSFKALEKSPSATGEWLVAQPGFPFAPISNLLSASGSGHPNGTQIRRLLFERMLYFWHLPCRPAHNILYCLLLHRDSWPTN